MRRTEWGDPPILGVRKRSRIASVISPPTIADSSVSTIDRILDELVGVIKSDRGMVEFIGEKICQVIVDMVGRLEELTQSTAERVAELANIDLQSCADSALKWMAKDGANLVDIDTSSMAAHLLLITATIGAVAESIAGEVR